VNEQIHNIEIITCPECGALLNGEGTCQDFFHRMLYWENEIPENGSVHHLMGLCYYLQHPSLYSQDGLRYTRQLLKDFIINGISPAQIRADRKTLLNSHNRKWKVTGKQDSSGTYRKQVQWKMTARDVVEAGIHQYIGSINVWAKSVYDTLHKWSLPINTQFTGIMAHLSSNT
jgi:hypothetical protein